MKILTISTYTILIVCLISYHSKSQEIEPKVNSAILEVLDSLVSDFKVKYEMELEDYFVTMEVYELNDECFYIGRTNPNYEVNSLYNLKGKFRFMITVPSESFTTPSLFFKYKNCHVFVYTGIEQLFKNRVSDEKKYKSYLKKNFGSPLRQPVDIYSSWVIEIDKHRTDKFLILEKGRDRSQRDN